MILFFKALHVVGFVAWFAGLFYLGRMFVYHAEASKKEEPERGILQGQYNLMEWRVYRIILNPAMVITWLGGLGMIIWDLAGWQPMGYFETGTSGWLIVKLVLVLLLSGYQVWCKRTIERLEQGRVEFTDWQFRLLNEVPTLFLIAIPFLAIFGKAGRLNYGLLVLGMVAFIGLLFLGARAYKAARARNPKGF